MTKIIYIYSKFSEYCKNLEPIITSINDINLLCIDNNISRSRVLKNKDYNIQVVPSIIVINDTIKIYEGDNAKDYIIQIYNNINKEQESTNKLTQNVIREDDENEEVEQDSNTSLIENVIREEDKNEEVEQDTNDLMSLVESMKKEREKLEDVNNNQ